MLTEWQQSWQRQEEAKKLRRRSRRNGPSEAQEQREVLRWLKTVARLSREDYAANNEGVYHGDKIRGAISRANGVRKGRPDIEVFARAPGRPDARGVAIEMKSRAKSARVSPEQAEFLARLEANGWVTCVARGSDEAIEFLKGLGFGK